MSVRHFVFLFVEDEFLSNILNAAIVALDPLERWPAHVTLAGPYDTRRSVPRDLRFDRRVSVLGVGQFRSERQNTVHFRVGAQGLRDVWRKRDYPYNPHMTLYDGSDHELGDELFDRLKYLNPIFKFDVTQLHVVTSAPQRQFGLAGEVDFSFLRKAEVELARDLQALTIDDRVHLAVECVKNAVQYCAKLR